VQTEITQLQSEIQNLELTLQNPAQIRAIYKQEVLALLKL
jgi:cell division protein FtsL